MSHDTALSGESHDTALSGVPHGTALLPLLILAYINNVLECVTFQFVLFAEDSLPYRSIRSGEVEENLAHELTWISPG